MTVKGAGFLLNDEMDDFTSKPGVPNGFGLIQGEANAIAPHKRPLSSMTPTILVKDGKLFLVIGSPGGPTIINTVLQVILNVIDHKMNIAQAIAAPAPAPPMAAGSSPRGNQRPNARNSPQIETDGTHIRKTRRHAERTLGRRGRHLD